MARPQALNPKPVSPPDTPCRQRRYNNDAVVAGSFVKSTAKLLYYYIFATLYGFVGGWANVSPKPSSVGAAPAPPLPSAAHPLNRPEWSCRAVRLKAWPFDTNTTKHCTFK